MLMYGIEKAEEKVNELNHLFKNPLLEKQIQYLVQCNNKYHYRYSEATIFEYIGISEMRVAEYYKTKENLYSVRDYKQENAKRDQKCLEKRVHWHNRIRTVSIARIMEITKEQAEMYTAEYQKYRKNRGSIKTAAYDLGMLHRRIQSYFQVGTRLVSEREGITKTRLLSLMEELNDLQNKRYEQEKRLRNKIP